MIHFVTLNTDTFINPTLVLVMSELVRRGVGVSLVSPPPVVDPPASLAKVQLRRLPLRYNHFPVRPGAVVRLVSSYCRALSHIQPGDTIIGIDPTGVRIAQSLWQFTRGTRKGYFCFEIMCRQDVAGDRDAEIVKRAELAAARQVDFCLIQDATREQLLRRESLFRPSCRWFQVPVAPEMAPSSLQIRKCPESDRALRVVHSGALGDWMGVPDILTAASRMDNCVTWEFHSPRVIIDFEHQLYRRWIASLAAAGKPVTLHETPFPDWDDYVRYL